ncbi:MAG: hypothetical protein ACYC9S_02395 [Leptospirales bacterium]
MSSKRRSKPFSTLGGKNLSGNHVGTGDPECDLCPVGERLAGSSFVELQRRKHDLDVFNSCPEDERNNMIGQKQKTNEVLDHSPLSSHVKRSSQERFHPTS